MVKIRDWKSMQDMSARLLQERTGEDVATWNHRIAQEHRIDLALRLEGHKPVGRLQPSKLHETTPLQISLASVDEIDTDVLNWLQEAYDQNI